jgi:hypothetical protein
MEYLLRKYNRVIPQENQPNPLSDEALVIQVSSIGSLGGLVLKLSSIV